jgi:hypothetical protein
VNDASASSNIVPMLALFRRLFSAAPPDLVQLARGPDREVFLRQLLRSNIFLFAALESDGVDAGTATSEQLITELEQAAKSLSAEDKGIEPFVYDHDAKRRLPFFSSEEHGKVFVSDYCAEHNRSYAFQMIGVRGEVLVQLLPICDELVLNDRTPDQVVIPKAGARRDV